MTARPSAAGECVLCSKIGTCLETSVGKTLNGHTCYFFDPVHEALVHARGVMMDRYGAATAVRAMLGPRVHKEEDLPTMEWTSPPPQGTTVGQRRAMLDQMGFQNVRHLGAVVYKCLTWDESLAPDGREPCKQKVIEFELANNIIYPDPEVPTSQGAPSMSQPFQPGAMPQMPQQPMPPTPPAPAMPQMPGIPQPPQFAQAPAPMAPPPAPILAAPPQVAAPGIPMPQQGEAPPPPSGKGKGKSKAAGAAAAPPPPPPPVMTGMPPPPMQQPGVVTMPQPQQPVPQQWVPGAFAAPAAPVQPTFQPAAPMMTGSAPGIPAVQVSQPPAPQAAPAQVDLGPVLAQVDAVGKALNAISDQTKQELAALRQQQSLILVALYHIYASDPSLSGSAKQLNWDLGSYEKFLAHLGNNLPR